MRNKKLMGFIAQAAVPAGPDHFSWLKVQTMDTGLSYWNLMVRNLCTFLSLYIDCRPCR